MTSGLAITRLPRPFDPDLGAEAAARVPALTGDAAALIRGAAGSSPYLAGLVAVEADWLPPALDDPDAACAALFADLDALAPDALATGLRRAKRRLALLTALADLAGAWPLETVTGHLTDLACKAVDLAIKTEIAALLKRGKLPGLGPEAADTAAGLSVLAMGKMGARELNYSSDIDLICLFDETRFADDDFHDARHAMIRATRAMCAHLGDRTADGYVFRTDLRLRPDPSVTPVCISMEAAERYYESLGRTWERAAYIKARAAAGDIAAGEAFLSRLTPFVWRRHLDFAAIEDAHAMRLRIRETKRTYGEISVPGHDMKLGRGGIREIEFFTQTRQLIAGGRDPGLRDRATVPALAALANRGWIPDEVAGKLTDHYRAHREVEHRIQMVHDAQTHRMPKSPDEIARLACLMGTDRDTLIADIARRLAEVHALTEDFFTPDEDRPRPARLDHAFDEAVIARWTGYPALRTQRATRIFDRLRPDLLGRLARTAKPDEALLALDGFLAGLPAGVQLFSLFDSNPQLIDLLVDIVGTAPALAQYLSRNSGVFDAVLGGDFFAPWPGEAALAADLAERLAAEPDYERQLDTARGWARDWHFRTGVHHLRGLIDGATAGHQYADLAGAVLTAILPVVTAQFAAKHGAPPGRGAAILGMGSLGARRLNAVSDLDLIVIYDPDGVDMSDGRRPLASRPYYARLTQALITALTAPMSQGRLYEVDMRLRPSGSQGPVATSLASFRNYQDTEAWAWEHLALTRARVVAGPADLAAEIEAFRAELLARPRAPADIADAVRDMRARLAAAKAPAGPWDAKTGPGRLMDIDLIAQAGALLAGQGHRAPAEGLADAARTGWLTPDEATALRAAADLYWSVWSAIRLVATAGVALADLGEGGAAFLCRATGRDTAEDLRGDLQARYAQIEALIDRVLEREVAP